MNCWSFKMKKILVSLMLFLLISVGFANSSNNTINEKNHAWSLLYNDKDIIILFDPNTLIFEKTDNGFNEPPTSKAVLLVRIIFTHPESHIDTVAKKPIQSFIALLVADCDKKQYTIIYGQTTYADGSVFNFPKPKKLDMKSVSEQQIKRPDTYMTLIFDYVYYLYKSLKEEQNNMIQKQKHIDKNGKMII